MAENYTAKSIKIMSAEDQHDRFDFVKVEDLIIDYPASSPKFIQTLIEACIELGVDPDDAIKRYLGKDMSIPEIPGFSEAYNKIMNARLLKEGVIG